MTRLRQRTDVLRGLARLGYGARGMVYLVVGALAVLDAVGAAGQESVDSKGALETILGQPFGKVLLGLVALGLVGHALWRLIQAGADADNHGTDFKGLTVRGGLLVSAITHAALAFFAVSLIFGLGTGGGNGAEDWTAKLLGQSFGRWLVIVVGVVVIGAGCAHIYKGATAGFERYLTLDEEHMRWARPLCQFGLIARGVVSGIIGTFFIIAAWHFNSGEAKGLKGALDTLEAQAYGPILLGVVALGLAAFGVYSLIEATHRRIQAPDLSM